MPTNSLLELTKLGQSIWYDNINRELLDSGELKRMVEEDGVTGVTSNPTIFDKAIAGSTAYDAEIRSLLQRGATPHDIYESLVVKDVRTAADILRPVFDATSGADGYVSLEVSPLLAGNTEETISQARQLFSLVDRPNLMIKVPATQEGIPAVEALIGEGIHVNVTLIFSLASYRQVADAYVRGLAQRRASGQPLNRVTSVASFFVSRVDTVVDARLAQRIAAESDPERKQALKRLLGTAAIANSKMAYRIFTEIFGRPFDSLHAAGAHKQRVLWASTSAKNPAYRDVLYVEELIGPHTVNTMPPATLVAFRDHGIAKPTLETDIERAEANLKALQEAGIDLTEVTDELLDAGVAAFAKSFEELMACITQKQTQFLANREQGQDGGLETCAR